MNKIERVKGALALQEVDRVPISVWMHFPSVDQDPRTLAELQVTEQQTYDLDFIKLMPFGLYSVQDWGCQIKFFCTETGTPVVHKFAIDSAEEWNTIKPLPPYFGNWGKQLLLAKYVGELVQDEVPFIQTLFSPLTTARKLAGNRIFKDMKTHPDIFHKALAAITETTINFVRENIKLGVSGFFFATQCADKELMSDDEFKAFAEYYDRLVLNEANQGTWFNILHMHGDNIRIDELSNYPVQALNWHDRRVYPSLKEARSLTDKCLIGGMDEEGALSTGCADDVVLEVVNAIRQAGSKGLMLGPGCVAHPDTLAENIAAARKAVEPDFISQQ